MTAPEKPLDAGEARRVARLVVEVAAAQVEKAGRDHDRFAVADGVHRPAGVLGGPGRALHLAPEADVPVDAGLGGGIANVAEDCRAVRDRLGLRPRPEPVAEGVHVGIGPHPGIPKQIPRPPDGGARLKNRVRLAREGRLQVVGGADAGQAGADDQHVDVVVTLSFCRPNSYGTPPPPAAYQAAEPLERRPLAASPRRCVSIAHSTRLECGRMRNRHVLAGASDGGPATGP
jgi:hypothetical protein